MDEVAQRVSAHYADRPFAEAFYEVLRSKGIGEGMLAPSDLGSFDHFHFGGAGATAELAALLQADTSTRVLDVGGGFGGPARMLAETYRCPVIVLDLTREYCEVGKELTARCGLDQLVSFQHGNALEIPYADASFDRVWTLHSSMNIEDKPRLFEEIHRVLCPGGRYVLYENMAGNGAPLHFPVPWARDPSISFLLPPHAIREILANTGFQFLLWDDLTDSVGSAMQAQPNSSSPMELQLIFGDDFAERRQNGARNLAERRAVLVRAILERV